jgi:protein-S-isoprenylcysteine O-methyltransferase Ste14
VRAYFTVKWREKGGEVPGGSLRIESEGKLNYSIRRFIAVPILSIGLFLYYTNPSWMKSFSIPLSAVGVWIGTVLGLSGIFFLIWVHVYLGKEWSARLQIRNDHQLIQSGPYSRIRHPMYTALFTIYFSIGVVSSNYAILVPLVVAIISLVIRIPKEEQMLIERFGESYKTYMKHTGKFIPKL